MHTHTIVEPKKLSAFVRGVFVCVCLPDAWITIYGYVAWSKLKVDPKWRAYNEKMENMKSNRRIYLFSQTFLFFPSLSFHHFLFISVEIEIL